MRDQHFGKAEFAVWLGIFGNILLALIKGIIGFTANSTALIADAAHTASNLAGSLAEKARYRGALRPSDVNQPESRGKDQSSVISIISAILLLVGIEIGVNAMKSISHGVEEAPARYAFIAIIMVILMKETIYRSKLRLGQRHSSKNLPGEHRSDIFPSITAFIGVGVSIAGTFTNQAWMYYADPIAGIFIAVLLIKRGYVLIRNFTKDPINQALPQEDARELMKAAQSVKGVVTVESLRAREQGHYVVVDVKISVNPRITVVEGHDVGKAIRFLLMDRFSHISDVIIHVNPYEAGYPYKNSDDFEQVEHPTILH